MTKKLYFLFASSTIVCSVFILLLRFDVQVPLTLEATKDGTFKPKQAPAWTSLTRRRPWKLKLPATVSRNCSSTFAPTDVFIRCSPAIEETKIEGTVLISHCSLFDVLVTKFE